MAAGTEVTIRAELGDLTDSVTLSVVPSDPVGQENDDDDDDGDGGDGGDVGDGEDTDT